MDNPQHYQPLSHALNPPLSTGPIYSNIASGSTSRDQLHEEEEEEEDDDEGMVEEQLHEKDLELQHAQSGASSPEELDGKQNAGCVSYLTRVAVGRQ